ncbi:MAG: HlyD family type I secretion periplasmic adaptor subunit, partial [Hyphomicrobiales bacterium]
MAQDIAKNSTSSSLRRYQIIGFALLLGLTVGLGGWAALASISGAVIASGQVVVESNSKKVQHLEGGIIAEIRVKEGARVIAGEVLVRLDDTETRARLSILNTQIYELLAKQARLEAERDGVDEVEFPPELTSRVIDSGVERTVKGQTRLFQSRRATLSGQKQQLQKRVEQQNEEITGLRSQQVAKETQAVLIKKELKDLIGLNKQGLVPTTRVLALQREAASLEGTRGELVAKVARIRGRISETELQLLQLDQDTRTQVLNELRDVQTQLAELIEKRVAAEAQLKRIDIVAPQSGYVHQLDVHTVGGVVGSGQALMTIVPQ